MTHMNSTTSINPEGRHLPPCVQERAGMLIAEIMPEALADVGAESFAALWSGRERTKRAQFLKAVADYFLLDASLEEDYEDEGLVFWLARLGASILAQDMLIRFVAGERAARKTS